MRGSFNDEAQVQTGSGAWTPPANVTEHDGNPLSPQQDFFVTPPPEIGAIKTAHSSLTRGKKVSLARRILWAAFWFAIGFGLSLLVWPFFYMFALMTRTPIWLWQGAFGGIWGYI